jgi:nucleotide-binding universal stress UspA family protein
VGLAQASGGGLVLVRVEAPGAAAERIRSGQDYLDGLARRLPAGRVPVDTEVRRGEPGPGILAATREHLADLVVMATRARTGLDRCLHGSVAEGVLRDSPVPVLLRRAGADAPAERLLAHPTILVPLDGTAWSEAALPVAQGFVRLLSGDLVLVEAVPVPWQVLDVAARVPMDVTGDQEARGVEARTYLRALAERLGRAGYPTHWSVDSLPPLATVLEAEWWARPALVVMATHRREGLSRLRFGSLTASVLHEGRTPVVAVPPGAIARDEWLPADASGARCGPAAAARRAHSGTGPARCGRGRSRPSPAPITP